MQFMKRLIILSLASFTFAFPKVNSTPENTSIFPRDASNIGENELPTVKLPYGTWRASSYENSADVYIFTNIPFAKPPIGNLRFAKPVTPPDPVQGIQDGKNGRTCAQILPKYGLNFFGDLAFTGIAPFLNGIIGNIGSFIFGGEEDCLLLDVYVPGKVIRNPQGTKVPVVNWIYGGAFLLGSKDMMGIYSGTHLIEIANGNLIWVAANYRLGAYGWLAGPTMEKEAAANVGLWDQRAGLQWIQDYIHLFGGDKTQVSAWGESAGASSILHHLVAFGGLQDPLFRRAVLLSPAFQPMGDRLPGGMLEQTYKRFENYAGCKGKGVACLRKARKDVLDKANQRVQDEAPRGSFGVGVAADGTWSRQYPGAELLQGNVVQGVESLIVSHTSAESVIFVDGHIQSDKEFEKFIMDIFGALATDVGFIEAVNKVYPPVGNGSGKYKNETARVRDFIRDTAFSCNSRYLVEAYPTKTWSMVYAQSGGWHGFDLVALFLRMNLKVNGELISVAPEIGAMSRTYQSYMVSHAVTGDPNSLSFKAKGNGKVPAVPWPRPPKLQGENIGNVLVVENGTFRIGIDDTVPKSSCVFLQNFMVKAQNEVGLIVGRPGTPTQLVSKGSKGKSASRSRFAMTDPRS